MHEAAPFGGGGNKNCLTGKEIGFVLVISTFLAGHVVYAFKILLSLLNAICKVRSVALLKRSPINVGSFTLICMHLTEDLNEGKPAHPTCR